MQARRAARSTEECACHLGKVVRKRFLSLGIDKTCHVRLTYACMLKYPLTIRGYASKGSDMCYGHY